jgi:hypothetical protein
MQITVTDKPRSDSHGRNDRRLAYFIRRYQAKMSHREERLAAAASKRARKNAKRVRDALRTELGQRLSRELAFGEPFSSDGIVDAVIAGPTFEKIGHYDPKLVPSDDQFASWALTTGSDEIGGYGSVAIDPETGVVMTSRYKGMVPAGVHAEIVDRIVIRRVPE